jgi:hypothetical protein
LKGKVGKDLVVLQFTKTQKEGYKFTAYEQPIVIASAISSS